MAFKDENGVSLDDREVMGELLGLLLAGHETTANTLTWALLLLARHVEAQDRLAAEALSVGPLGHDALEKLVFTRKVKRAKGVWRPSNNMPSLRGSFRDVAGPSPRGKLLHAALRQAAGNAG